MLAGRRDTRPSGWSGSAFGNKNNHSVVIRINFGQSSFLFTGDLEEEGIEELVDFYGNDDGGLLDVDVYQVGHHGSINGTTDELVFATSPDIAVISMGRWHFGRDSSSPFTTFRYGHPRQEVVELLRDGIVGPRRTTLSVMLGVRSQEFTPDIIRKKVYATGWTGTVILKADDAGNIEYVLGP